MSDLEGEDMQILARFAKRDATATLAGRRMRETRPLQPTDRRRLLHGSTKSAQMNLKVRPEFRDRVTALALNEGIANGRADRACCGGVRTKQRGMTMRALFGVLAVLLGLASICLTARYGYKSADTDDRWHHQRRGVRRHRAVRIPV